MKTCAFILNNFLNIIIRIGMEIIMFLDFYADLHKAIQTDNSLSVRYI